jgi:hypothetical protein
MGRVAEGASGISSGFCCAANGAARSPARNNNRQSAFTAPILVAILKSSIPIFILEFAELEMLTEPLRCI